MKIINDDINILETITKKNRISRIIFCCIGLFIVALFYNSFVVPNHIVYGGIGGVAIICNKAFGVSTTFVINAITIVFLIASYIILGGKKTSYSVIGFVIYDIMINLTANLTKYVTFQFDSYLFSIMLFAAIVGLGYGITYRTGFNTGGSDILMSILQHYFKVPNSTISNIMNGIVILIGASLFGIVNSLYALIFLKVCNFISDRVLIGISNSKICLITSKHQDKIEKYIQEELEIGYTLLDSTNGVGILPKSIIMCVIPSDRFYDLKRYLLHVDKKANLISNDCYAVVGGSTNALISIYN